MKIIEFNPLTSADQEMEVQLGEYLCKLRMTWNNLSEFWFLTITRSGLGLQSIKCVPSWPLFSVSKANAPIPGDILILRGAVTTTEKIEFEDLGSRWNIVYLTDEELASWETFNGLR